MNAIGVAGEVVSAGTALAGLVLIYIGSLVTGYGTHTAVERKSVRSEFATRAWIAFVGFTLALLASGLALIGKWLTNPCAAVASIWMLLAAFIWAIFATIQSIREIR